MARILIIDDEPALCTLCAAVLGTVGHDTVTAKDGFDGLALLRAAPADLVIMDMLMPFGGLSTLRVMRKQYPTMGLIVMSGTEKARLEMAGRLGAHRTLAKPFRPDDLIKAVDAVLTARPPQKKPAAGAPPKAP